MSEDCDDPAVDIAVDNDVLIKAVLYDLAGAFWPPGDIGGRLGVLGVARFVVTGRVRRATDCPEPALATVSTVLAAATALEPTRGELEMATAVEAAGQRRGLALDAGESQLIAMVIARGIEVLETGDKRAITGLEVLLDEIAELQPVCGRIRCLEQIVARCLDKGVTGDAIAQAICAQPDVDKTLSICCRCYSPPPQGHTLDPEALDSYITAIRDRAPRLLQPDRRHGQLRTKTA